VSYWITEYANEKQLQQDHPCVIRLIRDQYLRQPAPRDQPYQLDHPNKKDPSDGQSKDIIKILKNKVNFLCENHGENDSINYFSFYRFIIMMRWLI
jgi:hypothetical protein